MSNSRGSDVIRRYRLGSAMLRKAFFNDHDLGSTYVLLMEKASELIIPLGTLNREVFRPRSSIGKEAVLQDINALISVFKDGYGGWSELKATLESRVFPELLKYNIEEASTKERYFGKRRQNRSSTLRC